MACGGTRLETDAIHDREASECGKLRDRNRADDGPLFCALDAQARRLETAKNSAPTLAQDHTHGDPAVDDRRGRRLRTLASAPRSAKVQEPAPAAKRIPSDHPARPAAQRQTKLGFTIR